MSPPLNVKSGEWVVALYDDRWYPGLVESVDSAGLMSVSFMARLAGRGKFRWPEKPDKQTLYETELLCRLPNDPVPTAGGSRVSVDILDWKMIDDIITKI